MRTFELEQTCEAYPEQYWVKTGTETIGYIRLRFGILTCDYLPQGRPKLENRIRVLTHSEGDKYKGCFDSEKERTMWLDKCKNALIKEYQKHRAKKRQLNY